MLVFQKNGYNHLCNSILVIREVLFIQVDLLSDKIILLNYVINQRTTPFMMLRLRKRGL